MTRTGPIVRLAAFGSVVVAVAGAAVAGAAGSWWIAIACVAIGCVGGHVAGQVLAFDKIDRMLGN